MRTLTLQVWELSPAEKNCWREGMRAVCTLGQEGLREKDPQHELLPGVQEDGLLSRWIELPVLSEEPEHLPQSTKKTDIRIRAVKI